ncbi:MAG TPA: undecaprenyl-diphosphate phosphatase [Burkholderiales bacterium]|nr:undecaprenyl-diphosphate phosphatase [Burkholderiales bacterium]
MDLSLLLKALILGVVEGITEFLPVSSTGHLILVGDLLDFNNEKGKLFEIVIQCGAILAIVWEYRATLVSVVARLPTDAQARRFATNLLIAFLPVAVLGLLFGKAIKETLFKPVPVAMAFIAGGLIILWAERRKHEITVGSVDEMTWSDALKIGLAQCLALIPGTSRAGATIIGGLFFGLSRRAATEFSFFLAIPVLFAASAYELFKHRSTLSADDIGVLGVGLVAAFASAFVCVRWLLRYISRHDFTIFAWYRIGFGIIVLATAYSGAVRWTTN